MKVNIKQVRSAQEEHADIYAAEVTEQIQYAMELLENNPVRCPDVFDPELGRAWQKAAGHPALDHISFEVKEGQLFAFLGENGAGKSTTINILSTILKKSGGSFVGNFNNERYINDRTCGGFLYGRSCLDAPHVAAAYGVVAFGSVSSTALFMIVMQFFRSSSASGAFFGMLSAASGFVIGAFIPVSQFSESVHFVHGGHDLGLYRKIQTEVTGTACALA